MVKHEGSYRLITTVLSIVLFLTTTVIAQTPTNPMDSTPSKTDTFTAEELRARMGVVSSPPSTTTNSLPFPVDKNYPRLYVIPSNKRITVLNQGSCGSCVAYTTATVLSTLVAHQPNPPVPLLAILDPMPFFLGAGRQCTTGWWIPSAMERISTQDGAMSASLGIIEVNVSDYRIKAGTRGRISSSTVLPNGITKIDAMRKFISSQGALGADMLVLPSFNRYKGGVYNHQRFNDWILAAATGLDKTGLFSIDPAKIAAELEPPDPGHHAVTVIGYFTGGKITLKELMPVITGKAFSLFDMTLDLPAFWVVQNSWGGKWGMDGLFLIEVGEPYSQKRANMSAGNNPLDDVMYFMMDPIVTKNGVRLGNSTAAANQPNATPNNTVASGPVSGSGSGSGSASSSPSLEQQCFAAIQGKVAWNKAGNTSWSNTNIQNLCQGTTNPNATISCFQSEIQKTDNWSQAINTCKGGGSASSNTNPTPTVPNLNGNWVGYFSDGRKSSYVWAISQTGTTLSFADVGAGSNVKFSGQVEGNKITDSSNKTGTLSADGKKITWSDGVVWVRQ